MNSILVLSDTHGNSQAIEHLLEKYLEQVVAVVHLGDHSRDMARFARMQKDTSKFHIVSGNTDPLVEEYNERVIEILGKRIFITHGHLYAVKTGTDSLVRTARDLKVDACLFGHTHKQTLFVKNGIVFMNPGSPMYPQIGEERGYGLLYILDDGEISAEYFTYESSI